MGATLTPFGSGYPRFRLSASLLHSLRSFRNGSMRNPVVEKVILETLRVVHDIWRKYGKIDEIHVELGREMKLPKDKRERIFKQNLDAPIITSSRTKFNIFFREQW